MRILPLFLAVALSYLVEAQYGAQLKLPGPEIQKMLIGDWSLRLEYQPSPTLKDGLITTGEEKWHAGPGGMSLVEDFREPLGSGEVAGLGVLWWNDEVKGYQVLWCDSQNPSGCSLRNVTGGWQDGQLTILAEQEHGGKKVMIKEVFSDLSAMSFKQSFYSGPSVDDLKLDLVIRASRKKDLQ
jgi:hypothetical protein